MRLSSRFLLSLLLAFAASCSKTSKFTVTIYKSVCQGSNPMEGVSSFKIRVSGVDPVTGESFLPVETVVDPSAHTSTEIQDLPPSINTKVEVLAYQGSPDSGTLVSYGASLPFTIPSNLDSADSKAVHTVTVFLRPADAFSSPSSTGDLSRCTELGTARAGHTATLLKDGRVLFTGGFNARSADPTTWTFLADAEIYDPATGTVSPVPKMQLSGVDASRAFHTATSLDNGQVLVTGGETRAGAQTASLQSALLFDVGASAWSPLKLKVPRTRHQAAKDAAGRVLLLGGYQWKNGSLSPATTWEWYDTTSNAFTQNAAPDTFSRPGAVALPIHNGAYVAVAGGSDGAATPTNPGEVIFFRFDDTVSRYVLATSTKKAIINPGRNLVSGALLGAAGDTFIVVGGFTGADPANPSAPSNATDLVSLAQAPSRSAGPSLDLQRGDACTVGLADGRALTAGGRGALKVTDPLTSVGNAALIQQQVGGSSYVATPVRAGLLTPRHYHTCTQLPDGSVLIAGGIRDQGGTVSTLSSLEVFVPHPLQ